MTVVGPGFGDEECVKSLIKKESCILKTSGIKAWEPLADALRKMDFALDRHDNNVGIEPRENTCDCIASHVDDLIIIAKDSASFSNKIKEVFNL